MMKGYYTLLRYFDGCRVDFLSKQGMALSMYSIIMRVGLGALLLAVLPLMIFLSSWVWQPSENNPLILLCYVFTKTADDPWAMLTAICLALWFLKLLPLSARSALVLLIILAGATIGSQLIKVTIKNRVKEPRPFIVWLQKDQHFDITDFYQLPRPQRATIVQQALANKPFPNWLKGYWQNQTGYAFPSGHTIFASMWALMAMLFLVPQRKYITTGILCFWSIILSYSRLALGMHWPIDLLIGIVLSYVMVIMVGASYLFLQKRLPILALPRL